MTVAVAAGWGKLLGYWGSPCPYGPNTHLSAMYLSGSTIDFKIIEGPPYGPNTETKICPDCLAQGKAPNPQPKIGDNQ